MKANMLIETLGRIIKVEALTSIDYNIIPNTLVMENSEPFPGYFGHNMPKDLAPRSIFLITSKKYKDTKLRRIVAEIKAENNQPCDITTGSIRIYNNKYYCLRANGLSCFENIPGLQNALSDKGVRFAKKKKIHAPGRIILNKYFKLEITEQGLYKNLLQPEQYFIPVPRKLKWKEFYDISMNIKNNIDNKLFDAALGYMLRENSIVDFVRIYDKDQSPERMLKIRDMYMSEIQRL